MPSIPAMARREGLEPPVFVWQFTKLLQSPLSHLRILPRAPTPHFGFGPLSALSQIGTPERI